MPLERFLHPEAHYDALQQLDAHDACDAHDDAFYHGACAFHDALFRPFLLAQHREWGAVEIASLHTQHVDVSGLDTSTFLAFDAVDNRSTSQHAFVDTSSSLHDKCIHMLDYLDNIHKDKR